MQQTATPSRAGHIDRSMSLEIARVTEQAAIAAAALRGRGNESAADQAAVDAMRRELNRLTMKGRIVIGEGERDEAPMLYIGETVGTGDGPDVDIAVDPVEGTTLCAKNQPDCLAVLAIAAGGTMLHAPDIYMDKLAIGPGYPDGLVDIDATPGDNLAALAKAKGVEIGALTACILDRPRHAELIKTVRKAGAAVRLIGDGDVAGVMQTTTPEITGVDIYMGIGGAPEGVLAAAALRCIGGQMQARLHPMKDDDYKRAAALGISDIRRRYSLHDLVSGDVFFAATGVTDGAMLRGVRFLKSAVETETVVMRSFSKTVRWIRARHGRLATEL